MENKEYLNKVVERYNANPDDAELSDTEKALLSRLVEVEKRLAALRQQAGELEKDINQKTQSLYELRNVMVHEKGKSDGLVDALLSLKK